MSKPSVVKHIEKDTRHTHRCGRLEALLILRERARESGTEHSLDRLSASEFMAVRSGVCGDFADGYA